MNGISKDRVAGTLVGLAAGDALGAGYEFTDPGPDAGIHMKGGGVFGWEPGEWTDDTQMAICIAEVAAAGHLDPIEVGARFLDWFHSKPKDVGNMTRAVLAAASDATDLLASRARTTSSTRTTPPATAVSCARRQSRSRISATTTRSRRPLGASRR